MSILWLSIWNEVPKSISTYQGTYYDPVVSIINSFYWEDQLFVFDVCLSIAKGSDTKQNLQF